MSPAAHHVAAVLNTAGTPCTCMPHFRSWEGDHLVRFARELAGADATEKSQEDLLVAMRNSWSPALEVTRAASAAVPAATVQVRTKLASNGMQTRTLTAGAWADWKELAAPDRGAQRDAQIVVLGKTLFLHRLRYGCWYGPAILTGDDMDVDHMASSDDPLVLSMRAVMGRENRASTLGVRPVLVGTASGLRLFINSNALVKEAPSSGEIFPAALRESPSAFTPLPLPQRMQQQSIVAVPVLPAEERAVAEYVNIHPDAVKDYHIYRRKGIGTLAMKKNVESPPLLTNLDHEAELSRMLVRQAQPSANGLRVHLSVEGVNKYHYLHRVAATLQKLKTDTGATFDTFNPAYDGLQIDHVTADRTKHGDGCLRVTTPSQNMAAALGRPCEVLVVGSKIWQHCPSITEAKRLVKEPWESLAFSVITTPVDDWRGKGAQWANAAQAEEAVTAGGTKIRRPMDVKSEQAALRAELGQSITSRVTDSGSHNRTMRKLRRIAAFLKTRYPSAHVALDAAAAEDKRSTAQVLITTVNSETLQETTYTTNAFNLKFSSSLRQRHTDAALNLFSRNPGLEKVYISKVVQNPSVAAVAAQAHWSRASLQSKLTPAQSGGNGITVMAASALATSVTGAAEATTAPQRFQWDADDEELLSEQDLAELIVAEPDSPAGIVAAAVAAHVARRCWLCAIRRGVADAATKELAAPCLVCQPARAPRRGTAAAVATEGSKSNKRSRSLATAITVRDFTMTGAASAPPAVDGLEDSERAPPTKKPRTGDAPAHPAGRPQPSAMPAPPPPRAGGGAGEPTDIEWDDLDYM